MKIVKNTSNEMVSNLAQANGVADEAYNTIMSHLDQIESLAHTIDPVQYPEYLKEIWNKMDGVHHALGGAMQTQNPPINPNQTGQTAPIAPVDNPIL
jgi:hypothetical protein